MSSARLSIVLLLGLALLVVGCGGEEAEQLGEEELIEPIEVEVGESFEIVLSSNPTTGYAWELAEAPDEEMVTFEGSTYEAEADAEQVDGAGGEETIRFTAVGEGMTDLALEYVFSEDDDREPGSRVHAHIIVR